jgi:hypothetical protein
MPKFKVISSNPSNEGKTFVTKIQGNKVVNVLGVNKVSQVTYYISLPEKVEVDKEFDVDLSQFNITEHPFDHPDTGEIIQLKWLHIK